MPKLLHHRQTHQAKYFTETLTDTPLDMVLIPGGTFLMGAAENEEGASNDEYPQHPVTLPTFFMAKTPITQRQYQAIMGTNPAHFPGENRPVEQVSWHDAVEFCNRLTELTGRPYRLPSEAEWEYACRAGTTTPFHCGPTITTDLANYDGDYTYGPGPKGVYREETTDVGSFPPNAFGLYDLHGNVWEWCADPWHETYEDAPDDGSVWDVNGNTERRIIRGGSWGNDPAICRSANRIRINPDLQINNLGFRVVFSPPRTPSP